MRSWTEEEIEELARRFRQKIGIDDLVLVEAPTLVFKVCHYFPDIRYLRVRDHELPDPGGRWDSENKLLIYRESVFAGANEPNADPRCRWTMAHEVSHAVFDDQGIRNRSPKNSLEKRVSAKVREIESRTDRFTAAVLASLHLIEPDESVASIALRFGLSKEAAAIRSEEAARAYRRQHRIPRELPPSIKKLLEDLKNPKKR
jgi:Zn-dependent peptidase ImmA (M78 family)